MKERKHIRVSGGVKVTNLQGSSAYRQQSLDPLDLYLNDQLKEMTENPTIREAVYGHVGEDKQADALIERISM